MQRTKWFDRKFDLELPEGMMLNIIVRLSGTLPHLKELLMEIPDELLIKKSGKKWSIKENIGHLFLSEDLLIGRIQDIIEGKDLLRAAGFRNLEGEPDFNLVNIKILLENFGTKRKNFISCLENLDDETQSRQSLHPRLQVKMRPVDIAYFAAEHDDHHIAAIYEIIKSK